MLLCILEQFVDYIDPKFTLGTFACIVLKEEFLFLAIVSEVDKVVGDLSVELMKLRRTQAKLNVRMETHSKSKFTFVLCLNL